MGPWGLQSSDWESLNCGRGWLSGLGLVSQNGLGSIHKIFNASKEESVASCSTPAKEHS